MYLIGIYVYFVNCFLVFPTAIIRHPQAQLFEINNIDPNKLSKVDFY
jgi:hypothetical protein